jgi:Spy/CpxP family protein refolding chaperone
MSLPGFRKSIVATAAATALVTAGLWAGRLAAGPLAGRRHLSPQALFDRISGRLDLSAGQRTEIKGVLRAHRAEIVGQIQAQRSAREALRQAADAAAPDESLVRARGEALGRIEADGALLRARIRSELWPVLDEGQRQKVEAFRTRIDRPARDFAGAFNRFLDSDD